MNVLDAANVIGRSFPVPGVSFRLAGGRLVVTVRPDEPSPETDFRKWIRRDDPEPRVTLKVEEEEWRAALLRILENANADHVLPQFPGAQSTVTETFVEVPLESALKRVMKVLPGNAFAVT